MYRQPVSSGSIIGDYVNHDFAEYHIATNADVGESGIVGTAAAIANAVYHATGIRVRDLPITLDKLLR